MTFDCENKWQLCLWQTGAMGNLVATDLIAPLHRFTLSQSNSLEFPVRGSSSKSPGTYKKKLNRLTSGWEPEGQGSEQLPLRTKVLIRLFHLLNSSPTQPTQHRRTTNQCSELSKHCLLHPDDSLIPLPHPILSPSLSLFVTFHAMAGLVSCCRCFQNHSKIHKSQSSLDSLGMPFAKWPKTQQNWWQISTYIVTSNSWLQAWYKWQPVLSWNIAFN